MNLAELPFMTPDLPGVGGQIKAEPDHFIVEEVPLYPPSGEGEHLFITVTRAGQTTQQVVESLAAAFALDARDIGYAGLKDRHARTTQTFSLPGVRPAQVAERAPELGLELHGGTYNNSKLHTGHLLGNRFTITILDPTAPDALERSREIIDALQQRGLPNYFGAQRFGRAGDNAQQGLAILSGQRRRPPSKWLYKLLISAYQSQLFNEYLVRRIERGDFDQILLGDLAKKTDTGGMFVVEHAEVEQPRFARGEITFTGPLFGRKMREPKADAAELEAEILAACPITPAQWRQHHVEGNRRPGKLFLGPIELHGHPHGITLAFFLPKGSYATVLLREIMKDEISGLDTGD